MTRTARFGHDRCQTRARVVSDTVRGFETGKGCKGRFPVGTGLRGSVAGVPVSADEIAKVTVDGREVEVAKGSGSSRLPQPPGSSSGLLLRAAARPARRGLPDVPRRGRGRPEAAGRRCTETAQDGMMSAQRPPPPRPPKARTPRSSSSSSTTRSTARLRQGRRVPAPGPDLPLRPGPDADDLPEADVRQADPDLPDDRARPRALHPLLPLHPLLLRRRRGRPARGQEPRCAVDDRDLRGRGLHGAVQRQRDRALPRRRAHLDPVPLREGGRGRSRTCPPSAGSARSAATSPPRPARAGQADRVPQHPELDEGWLCDKGRFAYPHVYADDRIVDPLERQHRRGFTVLSWDDAVDRAEALLRERDGS